MCSQVFCILLKVHKQTQPSVSLMVNQQQIENHSTKKDGHNYVSAVNTENHARRWALNIYLVLVHRWIVSRVCL